MKDGHFELADFKVGDRVKLGAWTDSHMRGDAYGTVEKIGRRWLHVKFDKRGRVLPVSPCRIDLRTGPLGSLE